MSNADLKPESTKTSNLSTKLLALKANTFLDKCSICETMKLMDDETRQSFKEVVCSKVTISNIVDALNSEGIQMSRYALGVTRRKCATGEKKCEAFEGMIKNGK